MFKKILSHFLITLAVFSLVATFYIWFIDGVILNPSKLVPSLKDAGVTVEIAKLLPEEATKDASPAEKADMKAKISKIVTSDYVAEKLQLISNNIATYMRLGTPQPVVDISDFPAKLRASGVDVGTDIDKNFATPIELNKDGNLDKLPKAYDRLKILKIIGPVVFVALLLLEWYVAEKGQKLRRIGRIFLHTSIWFFVFWGAIILLPAKLADKLKSGSADVKANGLIDAVLKAVQQLFGGYLLSFAVACGTIAFVLYLLRHGKKHINTIKDIPVVNTKQKTTKQPKV
ncbi:MAG: hypothetical protein WCJ60_00145 [bacterium]